MRILITGATGFVGQYLVNQLISEKIDFITVSRVLKDYSHKHIQLDLLNIRDYSKIIRKAKVTHIIHLAWYVEHGKYWSSKLNIDWIKATTSLIEAFCQEGGKHVTIAGTCAEYDWQYGFCIEGLTPKNPSTIYGIAKDTTHKICRNISKKYNVPLAWGRLFFPYGKGEKASRLLPSLAKVFEGKQKPFPISGDSYRDFLHATDVASALVTICKNNASGSFNISSGEPKKVRQVVCLLAKIMSASPNKILDLMSSHHTEANFLVGNNDRLSKLGWMKTVELANGLKDYYWSK